jgi:uncharacterized protein (TIRG00374 family)
VDERSDTALSAGRVMLKLLIKLGFTAALLGILLARVDMDTLLRQFAEIDPAEAAIVPLLVLPTVLLQGERLRWMVQLRTPLSSWAALCITWIGFFFSQALPSAIGGDAFRIWYLNQRGLSLTESFSVALADRVLGFLALILLLAIGMPWFFALVDDLPSRLLYAAVVFGGVSAWIVALWLGFFLRLLPERMRHLRLLQSIQAAAAFLREATLASRAAPIGLALSVGSQLVQSVALWYFGQSLGLSINFAAIVFFLPFANLASLLPISVAGWGVREVVLVSTFSLIGVPPEAALALSMMVGFSTLAISLPGLGIWLALRKRPAAQ